MTRTAAHQPGNRDWKLIADWIETFAPCVYLAERETAWPRYVMLDALPFRLTARGGRGANASAFTILAAMGQDSPSALSSEGQRVLALRAFPGRAVAQQRPDWIEFLTELRDKLAGGTPAEFVVDLDPMIARAIKTVWPDAELAVPGANSMGPVIWWCHWHLGNVFQKHLADAGFLPDTPLQKQVQPALNSLSEWDAFTQAIAALRGPQYRALRNYMRKVSPKITWQVDHRYHYVAANGALETYLNTVRSGLNDRRGRFLNRERLNRLLELMVLEANSKASVPRYSKLIRAELEANKGFGMPRRQIIDPHNQPSLRVLP
jgi:hypothetical protein